MEQGAAAFDALVAAYEPGPGAGGLRALVPLAGRPLVEHQLRRAAAAGAGRLLLLVDEVPVDLAEVITALRREGLAVMPVNGLDIAAEALTPEREVLLVADACLADETLLRRLVARGAPCLATLPDADPTARHERIDAGARWAGVALLDGARVGAAAAMLGSWDPVSTLLRRAVQEGAPRLDAGGEPPLLLLDPGQVTDADARIVAAARPRPHDWVDRWVWTPLLDRVVPRLLQRAVVPEALAWPGALLALAAGLMALAGWRGVALAAFLVSAPLGRAGAQLARIADRPLALAGLRPPVVAIGALLGVVGWAGQLVHDTRQWGWALVAALLIGTMAGERLVGALLREARPLWLASIDALAWAAVPFALVGRWDAGLTALALYAGASLGHLQRTLMVRAAADAGLPPPKLF